MALFESAVANLLAAGADLVDDFRVPGFEHFPRPPQTAATTRADWERFFAYQGPAFPIKSVADLRDAPPGERVHPLHAARIAEIAAVTLAPEEDPETIEGRKTEQAYRDAFTAAMDLARVDALVLPVWTYPPVLLALLTLLPGFRARLDERQRRLWQLCQFWLWVNLVFWTVVPVNQVVTAAMVHSAPASRRARS